MPNRLSQLLRSAATDGRVDAREAEALVREAKRGDAPLPAEDRQALLALLEETRFEPTALRRLRELLGVTGGRVDLADPAPMKADAPVQYRDVIGGRLFVDGLSFDDVVQGGAGDCYFLSAVMSVAATTPDVLREAISENGDGTYTVRFFEKKRGRPPAPVAIQVDGELAHGAAGVVYATARHPKELWPALFEKAYAAWQGGYEHIGEGGVADQALFALTGKKATWVDSVAATEPDELWRSLTQATAERRPMVTSTKDRDLRRAYADGGLQKRHSYSLLRAFEKDGERWVQLRDPHAGDLEWGHGTDGSEDGNFVMSYADWRRLFAELYVLP